MKDISKKYTTPQRGILCLLAIMTSLVCHAFSGNGSGTASSPYLITSADELFEVRSNLNAYYKVINDIDLSSWIEENSPQKGWTPIGTSSAPFNGTFDGNGKFIKNLIIKRSDTDGVGLFGCSQSGTFKNITLLNPQIEGASYVGGILGYRSVNYTWKDTGASACSISNCFVVAGFIIGNNYVGGIAGYNSASTNSSGIYVEKCHNSSDVTAKYNYCGGICGYVYGGGKGTISVTNCNSIGNITGSNYVGGIIGFAECYYDWVNNIDKDRPDLIITNNYVGGNIKGKSLEYTNGVIGHNKARGWESGQWGSSRNTGVYTCSSNVCLADTIKGTYRISDATSSSDNYASISSIMLTSNNQEISVYDNWNNGLSMGLKVLRKAATYESLGWNFQTIWQDASNNEESPIHIGQSLAPKVEEFIAKSNGTIHGTTAFVSGIVYCIVNNNLYSSEIKNGKWELTLSNISEGEKAIVTACETDKYLSSTICVFAEKLNDEPIIDDETFEEMTFNFTDPTSMDIDFPTEDNPISLTNWSFTAKDVKIFTEHATECDYEGYCLELAKGELLTISVANNGLIQKIEFDCEGYNNFVDIDGLVNNEWTGNASSVTFSVKSGNRTGSIYINSINVTYKSFTKTLTDGMVYANSEQKEHQYINYQRNFTNTNWSALYVPFAMQYDDWAEDFEVARLNDVHQFDDDEDGVIDRTVLELIKLKAGSSTEPNTPYMIKAKETGEKSIIVNDATLYATKENSFDVTSWNTMFTFTGTYNTVTDMAIRGHYALANGNLVQASSDAATLSPFRWYLDITDRNGNPASLSSSRILLSFDDGVITEINTAIVDAVDNASSIYTLSGVGAGRGKSTLPMGLYISNGKKVLVR